MIIKLKIDEQKKPFFHKKKMSFAIRPFAKNFTMSSTSNENTTNTMDDEIEIINVGRDGMSFNELKTLHNMSMMTLNNMSKALPPSSSSSSTTPTTRLTLYSSRNVKISKANNNWLIPYHPFKEGCRVCRYFEHFLRNCPNILNTVFNTMPSMRIKGFFFSCIREGKRRGG